MGNASVRVKDLGLVCVGLGDELLELGDLANFFEGKDFILLVSVDSQTGTVVAPVFEPGSGRSWLVADIAETRRLLESLPAQAIHEGLEDVFAVLFDEVVDVAKNAAVGRVHGQTPRYQRYGS